MTYKTFGKKIISCVFSVFSVVIDQSAIREEEEYMTLPAAIYLRLSEGFGFSF